MGPLQVQQLHIKMDQGVTKRWLNTPWSENFIISSETLYNQKWY